LHSLPGAAGRNFHCGQKLPQDLPEHRLLDRVLLPGAGQNAAGQNGGTPGRCGSAQSERELLCLGNGPLAAWPARHGCWPPPVILPGDALLDDALLHDLADGHRKGGPKLRSLPDPHRVCSLVRCLIRSEASVVPGKVNDRLARLAAYGARMLILRPVGHPVAHPVLDRFAPREQVVPVSLLRCLRPHVGPAVCPGEPGHVGLAAVRCGELFLLCVVLQWFLARSHDPVGLKTACPWSCQAGRLLPGLASRWDGAVPSTRFLPGNALPQAWE
jgi:hypothetical protein